jgi:hypothetical protein
MSALVLGVVGWIGVGGVVHGAPRAPGSVIVWFDSDPLAGRVAIPEGAVHERLTWHADRPLFPGDHPGSLTARYLATAEPARLGYRLPTPITEQDPFTLYALVTLRAERFGADPFGFFQISWGVWNSITTGWERTGTASNFASDTFDLLELDYFPNESPFFGGPFLGPTLLAAADRANPSFGPLGAFANSAFASTMVRLPFESPLLVALDHDPQRMTLGVRVWRLSPDGTPIEWEQARSEAPLSSLSRASFSFDRFGLTLWRDGFSTSTPSLDADVRFELLGAWRGPDFSPGAVLSRPVVP